MNARALAAAVLAVTTAVGLFAWAVGRPWVVVPFLAASAYTSGLASRR